MAVDDLEILAQDLPEVFERKPLPEDWHENWIIVPEDSVESDSFPGWASGHCDGFLTEAPRWNDDILEWPLDWVAIDFEGIGTFGGFPATKSKIRSPIPPPDCFAFYLPFHYYYPDDWGIYIYAEGMDALSRAFFYCSQGVLTFRDAQFSARGVLYGHEAFHHAVEAYATRLEITHRKPLYKTGFQSLFESTQGKDDCLEEALANAAGLQRIKKQVGVKKFRDASRMFERWIDGQPPGYRRAFEFITQKKFTDCRSEFAERNHSHSLKGIPSLSPGIWANFPHAFHGFANVRSRVNYIIYKDSPLASRVPLSDRCLRYREVEKKLKALAQCVPLRQKGSHVIWRNPSGGSFPVPRHTSDLRTGTLAKIIKQAGLGISVSEFVSA